MRYRITIVFILILITILISSILRGYKGIQSMEQSTQINLLSQLTNQTMSGDQIRSEIAIYRSLSEKRIIEQSRKMLKSVAIELAVLSFIFIILILGITRPLQRLSHQVSHIDPEQGVSTTPLIPSGSLEVRNLTRNINEMLSHIQEYSSLIGNRGRYKGWKEISRVIVHELNNILSPIRTYGEYLLEHPGDTEKIEMILDKINETQLTLSRFRSLSHLPQIHLESTDILELCLKVCREFDLATITCEDNTLRTEVDPVLFGEIIRNLIKNARETSSDTKINIHLQKHSNHILISVEDNGGGMTPDTLDKIFNPGFTTKEKNSGIGLAVVNNLIQEHKAILNIDNQPGTGCTFIIKLPLHPEQESV